MNAFAVVVDDERTVFRTYFRGVVVGEELNRRVTETEPIIATMRRGFTVVADLAELERMELDCVPHVTRLMDRFVAARVGRVVRVIPDPSKDIGFTLLSLTHYRGRVPIVTYRTREDAARAIVSA